MDLLEPIKVRYDNGSIIITLSDGREVTFPCAVNEYLSVATEAEISKMEISPCGIHWPLLNEDLSIKGILEGRFGRTPRSPK